MAPLGASSPVRIGITGATGFVGRRLAELAVGEGHPVRCLVRPSSRAAGLPPGVELERGDLGDAAALARFVRDLDVVVHLAAEVGAADPRQLDEVNVAGTRRLCEAILAEGPRCRLVHCSSVAALGVRPLLWFLSTPYARSKRRGTRVVDDLARRRGLRATTVFPGMIYGPGDERFVPQLVANLEKGKLVFVSGGERHAPLVYVDDLCELLLLAARRDESAGRRYLAIGQSDLGMHDFIRAVARRAGLPEPRVTVPKWLVLPAALALEAAWALLGRRHPPPLTRRVVDVLSIRYDPPPFDEHDPLAWRPRRSTLEGLALTLPAAERAPAA